MKINRLRAEDLLRRAAEHDELDKDWIDKIKRFSDLCEQGSSKTHIAFLGTSMLAKAVEPTVDLRAIKPRLAPGNPLAYSARSLCHGVLVPLSAELDFDIGVTGREPLNNQPYFRMTFLGDETPVHAGGRVAFDYMLELIGELEHASGQEAERALAAFIGVRRGYVPKYSDYEDAGTSANRLIAAATEFVRESSEGGKRAQAVAAGLVDVFAGSARVLSGRINDPSRKYPGDVCVLSEDGSWEKSFEVRDKPVSGSDIIVFARKCRDSGVREAAVVMASPSQGTLEIGNWAERHGIGLTLFYGWSELAKQSFFWSAKPTPVAASEAAVRIHERLKEVEIASSTLAYWKSLLS